MRSWIWLVPVLLVAADDDKAVFRSDVSLVRVDTQVLDRDGRAITGLKITDFALREQGKLLPIRNFAREDMPVDVLFLLDVSASMRPHVERIAAAAHQAMSVLGTDDRVGIMVFDRATRIRMPFKAGIEQVEQGFDGVLRQENFRGGTDITLGLIQAANYVKKNARPDARRAIVILTDDQTEFHRDDEGVLMALERADAVLSALLAPNAMNQSNFPGGGGYPGGGRPGAGSGWPGGQQRRGGGIGGALGGIILGGGGVGFPGGGRNGGQYPNGRNGGQYPNGRNGGQYPGGGYPDPNDPNGGQYPNPSGGQYPNGRNGGPVILASRTRSAGTAEIAEASGGDSLPVQDASALLDTLTRIRKRYAIYFTQPADARPGQERTIELTLADATRRKYPEADLRYRHTYRPESASASSPVEVTSGASPASSEQEATEPVSGRRPSAESTAAEDSSDAPPLRRTRRPAVDDTTRGQGPMATGTNGTESATPSKGGWRRISDKPSSDSTVPTVKKPAGNP
ncbi:MAG: VWA domain-containing protein [Acidobacteria bacterium]|nr:VWA domain-containing protein [Acidobacteriota bacterium]